MYRNSYESFLDKIEVLDSMCVMHPVAVGFEIFMRAPSGVLKARLATAYWQIETGQKCKLNASLFIFSTYRIFILSVKKKDREEDGRAEDARIVVTRVCSCSSRSSLCHQCH